MGKKKELFDNEIRKAQKEIYDREKKIFATAYRDNDKVYILVNKNISRLTNEVSSSEIENMWYVWIDWRECDWKYYNRFAVK